MEGKPAKVLGRPAKTDVRSYVLGASPMPSSIYGQSISSANSPFDYILICIINGEENMSYKGPASTVSDEEFKRIVLESTTFVEVIRKLGYITQNGGPYKTVKKRIKLLNIDISHMTHRSDGTHGFERTFTNDDIFCKDSKYKGRIRPRVLKDKLIPYECTICGNKGEWNGKPLTLTLDHINGDNSDNRLKNLRFVCPNCDSQQDTYAGKNKNKYNKQA